MFRFFGGACGWLGVGESGGDCEELRGMNLELGEDCGILGGAFRIGAPCVVEGNNQKNVTCVIKLLIPESLVHSTSGSRRLIEQLRI